MPFYLHIIQSCYNIMKIHSAVSCNMYAHVMNCVLRLISITSIQIGHVLIQYLDIWLQYINLM